MIEIIRSEIEKTTIPCPIVAHAGDGNVHVVVMIDSASFDEIKEAKSLVHLMGVVAIEMGGTCTGEHGVGVGKMDLLEEEMGVGSIEAMKRIKREFDPNNIMNPGKILYMNKSCPAMPSSPENIALIPSRRLC